MRGGIETAVKDKLADLDFSQLKELAADADKPEPSAVKSKQEL